MLVHLQILNKIISTKDISLITDNNITSDYFPNAFRGEFDFIINHYKKYGQVPDLVTVLKSFPDFEVIESSEPDEYLLNELYRVKDEDYLASTFKKMKRLLENGETDKAMELFTSSAQNASEHKQMEAVDILEDTSRYDSYVDKCNDFMKYYLPTGFKELDDSFGGGIDRQNAYFVISARAGIGKTLVMIKFAAAAVERGLRVGLYEGEMTVDKIAGRYDTLVSHISNSSIVHGNINVEHSYREYLKQLKEDHKGNFYILTRDMVSNDKMTVDVLRTFVEKYKLDILFIDQLSLLDSTSQSRQSFEQAADISKQIKNLQVQKHIPIVVASQQNRSSIEEGGLAGTQNLSLSDRIGQDATEVLFLTKKDNIMTFNIAKARDGAKKYVLSYEVDFDTGRFTYIPDDEDFGSGSSSSIGDESYDATVFSSSYNPTEGEMPFGH